MVGPSDIVRGRFAVSFLMNHLYLTPPRQEGPTYGFVDYDDATDSYVIEAEPAVFETAKRIFPGCVSRMGAVRFKSTKRSVGDLNWLMLRYPLEVRCSKRYEMDRKRAVEHADFREGVKDNTPVEIPPMFNGKLIAPYQPEGVSFLVNRKKCVLADDVGCISGDAIIQLNRAGKGFKLTLRDLYLRFHRAESLKGVKWKRNILTKCRAMCGGELRMHRVRNVLSKGRKAVVKIRCRSGKSVVCTPDHEIASTDGKWIRAEDLECGSKVLTNGQPVCRECKSPDGVVTDPYKRYPGLCRKCIYAKRRGAGNPSWKGGKFTDSDGYVRVSGKQGHPRANSTGQVYEHILVMEKKIGRFVRVDEIVHHKNEDKSDNRPGNLELLGSAIEHMRLHGKKNGYRHFDGKKNKHGDVIHFIPVIDEVVSVTPVGMIDVYDVVMDDPHRNFVADGVIVHNCGKTVELLAALASTHAFPALVIVPPNITTQWSRMVDVFMRFGQDMPSWQILRGLTPYEFPRTPITICHYGLLRGWGEKLREFGFRSLLLDEIHELRHADTKKYSVASDLAGMCDYVWGASATPIFGYGSEIWAVMNIIDYHCLGDSDSFTKEWCDSYDGKIVEKPDVLGDYLRREGLMLRRRKEDVMSQLPPKRRVVTVIDKDDDEYAQLIAQAVRLARGYAGIRDFHTRGQVAREIDQIARQATGISKAPYVADFVASLIESGERVLLYAHHHKVHDIITERLKKFHPVRISGRETIGQKDAAMTAFAKGVTPIVQLSTRSTAGLDGLQGMGTCCVFGELDWSPAAHLQAEGRLHRHGMNTNLESLLCYYLVSDSGMDEVMQEALGLKVGQFVGLMGDKAETEDDREIASKVARKHLDSMIARLQQEHGISTARNGHAVRPFRKPTRTVVQYPR